jgi:uncharacterized membrane protein YkoI
MAMKTVVGFALASALALGSSTVAAQTPQQRDSTHTMRRAGAADSMSRVDLQVKVDASVASSAKISADSAQAIALAKVDEGGKVNSGELKMEKGKLVYEINVVPNGKNTVRKFNVDAMTGDIVSDRTLGGLNAAVKKHQQHTKEVKAKASKDTTARP